MENITCIHCKESVPVAEYIECEVECDRCSGGTHSAIICPECFHNFEAPYDDEDGEFYYLITNKKQNELNEDNN